MVKEGLASVTEDSDCDSEAGQDEDDPIFSSIQDRLSRHSDSVSTLASVGTASAVGDVQIHDNFTSVPYGFQPRAAYEHTRKNSKLMGVTYNGRTRQFILVDSKGISTWAKDSYNLQVSRPMTYPKYEYKLVTSMIYARKYNVYFVLWKDFSLRVLNRDFEETCSVSGDMRSVLFMVFNPIKDELITGGVGGTKVWMYHQAADRVWSDIKPMANYRLKLKYELPNVGGSWVKKVELDLTLQHLYCCSDTDLHAYDLEGNLLFQLDRAHQMSIIGCVFSASARLLITASLDAEVKAWSLTGGLVHTFRGHSRAITHVVLHPETSALFLTSSLDGTVRLWSLDIMDVLYSVQMSAEGVLWMGITDDNFLYVTTSKNLTVWSLNQVYQFWATARNRVTSMWLVPATDKSTRLVAVGEDSSVRIFSRVYQKNLSTVLPPPSLSPMQKVKDVCYNRAVNAVFLLINTSEIWVYTTRTDPASRIAVWDATEIQRQMLFEAHHRQHSDEGGASQKLSSIVLPTHATQRALEGNTGHENIAPCCCICYLDSPAQLWTDEGMCCPLQQNYLLFGLEDGRILFMDPVIKSQKYMELRANKDAILNLRHEREYSVLVSRCMTRGCSLFQFWSLPQLQLLHQVYSPSDVTDFAMLEGALMTGHENGAVHLHPLVPLDDPLAGPPPWLMKDEESVCVSDVTRTEHTEGVLSVDSCHTLKLFVTCSCDGAVKVWEENKKLVTEIALDSSLTSCCFLNSQADLLVGLKNHVFFIPHAKVCPSYKVEEEDIDETESEVYEDPAIKFEGLAENPDPVDLESYLVPYDIEFSKDFIEGKDLSITPRKEKPEEEESDGESGLSHAPTSMFTTPRSTPRHLSMWDLTLSSEVTAADLQRNFIERVKKARARFSSEEDIDDREVAGLMTYAMPKFGVSPGPTPSPSSPSAPSTPSFGVSEGEYSLSASDEEEEEPFEPIDKAEGSSPQVVEKPKARKSETPAEVPTSTVKAKLAGMSIDAQALIKQEAKKQEKGLVTKSQVLAEADHSHAKSAQVEVPSHKPARPVNKKAFKGDRKMPKRGAGKSKSESRRSGSISSDVPVAATTARRLSKAKVVTKLKPSNQNKPTPRKTSLIPSTPKEPEKPKEPAGLTKQTIPTSDLQIGPRKVGAAAVSGGPPRKRHGRRMELIGDAASRPVVGASPTAELLHQENHEESATTENVEDTVGDVAESDEERAIKPILKSRPQTASSEVTQGAPGQHVEFEPETAPSSRTTSARTVRYGAQSPAQHFPDGDVASIFEDDTAFDDTMSVSMSRMDHYDASGSTGYLKDSGMCLTAPYPASGTTSASVSRSRSPGGHSDYESIMSLLAAETEQYIKELADDAESVGFGDESRDLPWSRPVSSYTRSSTRPTSGWTRPTSGLSQASQRPGSSWSRPFSSGPSRPTSGWSRAPSRLDGGQTNLDILAELDEDVFLLLTQGKEAQRPHSTSFLHPGQAGTAADEKQGRRPYTAEAAQIHNKELQMKFEEALRRYRLKTGNMNASNPLQQNSGNEFQPNWHERNIERHLLLKLQKILRCRSAREKRNLLDIRQHQRRQSILGHRDCDKPVGVVPSSHSLDKDKASRIQSAMNMHMPRPPAKSRPQTAAARLQGNYRTAEYQKLKDRSQKAAEMPYRFTLGMFRDGEDAAFQRKTASYIDPRLLDPRDPMSFMLRGGPTKSIPSKCSRYVLVSHKKQGDEEIIATPLEEQLILQRFPKWSNRWLHCVPQPYPQPAQQAPLGLST